MTDPPPAASVDNGRGDRPYPDPLPIEPVSGPVRGCVTPPGSKSYTNRALPLAALAKGSSTLHRVLDSEDTRVMRDAISGLGVAMEHDRAHDRVRIDGCSGRPTETRADFFLANSGTSVRFLTAVLSACPGRWTLDGVPRMRERPIEPLLDALGQVNVAARSAAGNGCPPVEITTDGLPGGEVAVRGDISSQYLSGLLLAGPLTRGPLTIRLEGELVSVPYVAMTLRVMESFGARVEIDGYRRFVFEPASAERPGYLGTEFNIEPDASAASYFFGAAAVTGGEVEVHGLGSESLQGDLDFVDVLERMGCSVERRTDRTRVVGSALRGIEADLRDISDTVPTLAAVACHADGPTTIRGVEHIRYKETDRIAALATEIRKTGCGVEEFRDGLRIEPAPDRRATLDTYDDHRMAMSFSLIGLKGPGVDIRDPGCTRKTYPGYFDDLSRLLGRSA